MLFACKARQGVFQQRKSSFIATFFFCCEQIIKEHKNFCFLCSTLTLSVFVRKHKATRKIQFDFSCSHQKKSPLASRAYFLYVRRDKGLFDNAKAPSYQPFFIPGCQMREAGRPKQPLGTNLFLLLRAASNKPFSFAVSRYQKKSPLASRACFLHVRRDKGLFDNAKAPSYQPFFIPGCQMREAGRPKCTGVLLYVEQFWPARDKADAPGIKKARQRPTLPLSQYHRHKRA